MSQEKQGGCELTKVGPFLSISRTINQAGSRFGFKTGKKIGRAKAACLPDKTGCEALQKSRVLELRKSGSQQQQERPRSPLVSTRAIAGQQILSSSLWSPSQLHSSRTTDVGPAKESTEFHPLVPKSLCKVQIFTWKLSYHSQCGIQCQPDRGKSKYSMAHQQPDPKLHIWLYLKCYKTQKFHTKSYIEKNLIFA